METAEQKKPIEYYLEPPNNVTNIRKPECDFFNICGGCSFQHIPQKLQINIKQNILINKFKQSGINLSKSIAPLASDEWHYRHRARLSVKYDSKKDRVLVGFREAKNSRFVANIDYCKILTNHTSNILSSLKEIIHSLSIKNKIPQIEVVCSDDNLTLIFRILEQLSEHDLNSLTSFAKNNNVQIYLQPGNELSMYPLDPLNVTNLYYKIPKYNVSLKFQPHHFTQINFNLNKKMVEQAITLLDCKKTDTVLDLFCGIGNFSIPIATLTKEVIGIELSEDMIQQAKQNAVDNKLTNTVFIALNLQQSECAYTLDKKIDKVIIDPPRTGASDILPKILSIKPEYILYISCNPDTLVSDTEIIVNNGYYIDKYGIVDMFPHTKHIESMVLFKHNDFR